MENLKQFQKQYAVMLENRQTPTKLYDSYGDALNEAERLVKKDRNNAYILLAVAKLELNDIKITSLID